MLVRFRSLALICLLLLANANAFAWNNIGHMAVAYIAWQHLGPLQGRVSALIQKNPKYQAWSDLIPASITGDQRNMYLFMIAATWPDQIKGDMKDFNCGGHGNGDIAPADESVSLNIGYDADKCMHKYWHFVDVSYDPDGTPPHPTPAINAEVKIDFLAGALHTAEPDELKSYDLVWLEHLVGDIHQPLHCVTRHTKKEPGGDQGGLKVQIESSEKELHAYWDDILGDKTSSLYSDARLAETVANALPAPKPTLAADSKTADWKMESVTDAEDFAYNTPIGPGFGPYPISNGYHTNALNIARERVSIAGIRLANLIKTAQP